MLAVASLITLLLSFVVASLGNVVAPTTATTNEIGSFDDEHTNFAYVTLLCNPDKDEAEYIRMLLVLKESVRQFDEKNDIVVMVYGGIKEEQWELLDKEGFQIVLVGDVGDMVSNPEPLRVSDELSACYRSKMNAVHLTQYERVIFLDNDVIVKKDIQFMFEGHGLFAYEGFESPLNTGIFAVSPSEQAFDELQHVALTDNFNPKDGWMGYGVFPHWRLEGHVSDWSFWCAHTDQGIMYYYFDKFLMSATILPMKASSDVITHFTGWNKPVLHSRNEMMHTGSAGDSFAQWYGLWDRVQSRLDNTNVVDTETNKEDAEEESSTQRLRRSLATDPYCDPYDDVSLVLYNTDTNMPIGPLGETIDACMHAEYGLSIVALPPCKDKVKFKLLTADGEQLMKHTEGVPPMSLGGDDDKDLYPVDLLKEPGMYLLEVNPAPGAKTKFYYEVVGC